MLQSWELQLGIASSHSKGNEPKENYPWLRLDENILKFCRGGTGCETGVSYDHLFGKNGSLWVFIGFFCFVRPFELVLGIYLAWNYIVAAYWNWNCDQNMFEWDLFEQNKNARRSPTCKI